MNKSYFFAVVTENKGDCLIGGEIKRPLIKVAIEGENGGTSEISLVFPNNEQGKRVPMYKEGSLVFFSALAGEGESDELVFYPLDMFVLKEGYNSGETVSKKVLKSKLSFFSKSKPIISFDCIVTSVSQGMVSVTIPEASRIRGETDRVASVWIRCKNEGIVPGISAVFVGGIQDGILDGRLLPIPEKTVR